MSRAVTMLPSATVPLLCAKFMLSAICGLSFIHWVSGDLDYLGQLKQGIGRAHAEQPAADLPSSAAGDQLSSAIFSLAGHLIRIRTYMPGTLGKSR